MFEKLELSHKEQIGERLEKIGYSLSEYCFSNLYLFRDTHKYEIMFTKDSFFIKGESYDKKIFLMPGCGLESKCEEHIKSFLEEIDDVDMIYPIPHELISSFPEHQFSFECLESDLDYVYEKDKLQFYPGRKLQSKRNLVKQHRTIYERNVVPLKSAESVEAAKMILDSWQEAMPLEKSDTDYEACLNALCLIEELDLEGFLFYSDGKPSGFTLGGKISDEMYGLHFAKGDKDVKGLYQYMFSKTAELIDENYKYMNLEQDLGQLSLRRMKSSYKPEFMAKKYRIFKK